MLTVYLENGSHEKTRITEVCSPINGKQLMGQLTKDLGVDSNLYFLKNNGLLVEQDHILCNGDISLEPKLCGGKGGFGSMLRAIGAQIEKTTNREACRDLSGRRLRDINEEKRLKAWIEKQGKRDEEAVERKKRKLEKLRAEPKHEFKDKSYEKQRSELTERVEDAVEVGFATASKSGIKRPADKDVKTNLKKKVKTILDDDIDSDDLDSSDDDSDKPNESVASNKFDGENSSSAPSSCPGSSSNEEGHSKFTNDSLKPNVEHSDDTSR